MAAWSRYRVCNLVKKNPCRGKRTVSSARRTVRRRTDFIAGFPPCGRPRARHSDDRRFGSIATSDSGSISFVSYPPLQVRNNSSPVARWVGTRLATGSPPGTVRAPLDAYGSTSDNIERAGFSEANLGSNRDGDRWYLRHRPSRKQPDRVGGRTTTSPSEPLSSLQPGHEESVLRKENGPFGTPNIPRLHLRQWVSPSSTRLSPITPLRQFLLHFLGNGGIRLPRMTSAGRELPPYPGHYPGPWLGPLSFIARHTPARPP